MTRNEANKELKNNREKYNGMLRKFCPVISSMCRLDCICFNEARIWTSEGYIEAQGKQAEYQVAQAYCSHVMISGDSEVIIRNF